MNHLLPTEPLDWLNNVLFEVRSVVPSVEPRQNHYSVNPLAINNSFSYESLVAGAIVGHSKVTQANAVTEARIILGSPIRYFEDMDSAVKWIMDIVKNTETITGSKLKVQVEMPINV